MYAPLTTLVNVGLPTAVNVTAWQSATVLYPADTGYAAGISCGDSDAYTRLKLAPMSDEYEGVRCARFDPTAGSLGSSCQAFASTCTINSDGLTFAAADDSGFGTNCAPPSFRSLCALAAAHCHRCLCPPPQTARTEITEPARSPTAPTSPRSSDGSSSSSSAASPDCSRCSRPGRPISTRSSAKPTPRSPRASPPTSAASLPSTLSPVHDLPGPQWAAPLSFDLPSSSRFARGGLTKVLTGIEVADPRTSDPEVAAKMAAYDHYSDGELIAAAAAGDAAGAVLRGKVVTRLALEALTVVVLLGGVFGTAFSTDNMDVLSAAVTFCSLIGSLVVFGMAFDAIRLSHFGSTMAGSKWLETEQLQAHVDSFKDRSMTRDRPLLKLNSGGFSAAATDSNPVATDSNPAGESTKAMD